MGNSYIYNKVEKLVKKFKTRDPFEILEEMNVIVGETDRYEKLKGYCFMSCQTIYVMVSSFLSEEEKKIVAAHELGPMSPPAGLRGICRHLSIPA